MKAIDDKCYDVQIGIERDESDKIIGVGINAGQLNMGQEHSQKIVMLASEIIMSIIESEGTKPYVQFNVSHGHGI